MDFQELYKTQLFELGDMAFSLGQLFQIIFSVGGICLLGYLLLKRVLPRFYERKDTSAELHPRARRVILSAVVTFSIIAILRTLELDYMLYETTLKDGIVVKIRISTIMQAMLTLVVAGLIDWSIEEFLVQRYHRSQDKQPDALSSEDMADLISDAVRPVVYSGAALLIANNIGIASHKLTTFGEVGAEDSVPIVINNLIAAALLFFVVRLIVLLITRFALARYYRRSKVDAGSQYALDRLLTYFVYLIGVLLVLQTAGFSLLGLWTGAAALLVGLGIGLQQTFNDLICGVIILFERSVKVGDVVDMGGPDKVGVVRKIGSRTSQVETRDNILMFVPNSKLIGDSVVNWSQTKNKARFHVSVGVAYGSDTSLVKKILLEAADKHGKVLKSPKPLVRFLDFGSSSLDFDLLFYTSDFIKVEDVRSDLRFLIDAGFRAHNIEIPFPQRDIWVRGGLEKLREEE